MQAAEAQPEAEDQQVGGIFEVGTVARYVTKVSVHNRFDAFEDDEEEVAPATVYSFGPETRLWRSGLS